MRQYDVIVVGAGFAGAVAARQLAEAGNRVLVLEQRNHIGGNAYDCLDGDSVLVHRYGPHIFHTNNKDVFDYLSRFTKWRDYEHRVVADIRGTKVPLPFNLDSISILFGDKAEPLKKKLVDTFGMDKKVSILELRQSEDKDLVEMSERVYEDVFLYYSKKQWGRHFEELDPATFSRVPVYISHDDRYFQDKYQGMPEDGYTALFQNLLEHDGIEVRIGVKSESFIAFSDGNISFEGKCFDGIVVYTGLIDELFKYCFGHLPYRTLDFCFETHEAEWYQSHSVVNYTVDKDYTRITEFKRLTGQELKDRTTIIKEYPREYGSKPGDIPYYPIKSCKSAKLYSRYAELAERYPRLRLLGRLAEYRYYDMDLVVSQALKLSEQIAGTSF